MCTRAACGAVLFTPFYVHEIHCARSESPAQALHHESHLHLYIPPLPSPAAVLAQPPAATAAPPACAAPPALPPVGLLVACPPDRIFCWYRQPPSLEPLPRTHPPHALSRTHCCCVAACCRCARWPQGGAVSALLPLHGGDRPGHARHGHHHRHDPVRGGDLTCRRLLTRQP